MLFYTNVDLKYTSSFHDEAGSVGIVVAIIIFLVNLKCVFVALCKLF